MPLSPDTPMRLAVFASGGGSNFQAILDAVADGSLNATVALCLSNRSDAGALDRARAHQVATSVLPPSAFDTEESYVNVLMEKLNEHEVNFIALAGYMKKIPAEVVDAFRGRMLNIHPALLPAFGGPGMYGRRVHEAVFQHGVRWTGATVHLVDENFDTGPIVLQEPVPVHQDDTPQSLADRVLNIEHKIYPEALRLFADGHITLEGRRVLIGHPQRPSSS